MGEDFVVSNDATADCASWGGDLIGVNMENCNNKNPYICVKHGKDKPSTLCLFFFFLLNVYLKFKP